MKQLRTFCIEFLKDYFRSIDIIRESIKSQYGPLYMDMNIMQYYFCRISVRAQFITPNKGKNCELDNIHFRKIEREKLIMQFKV